MPMQLAPVLVAIFCINKLNSVKNEKYASQQDKQMHWWHLQNTVGALGYTSVLCTSLVCDHCITNSFLPADELHLCCETLCPHSCLKTYYGKIRGKYFLVGFV